ncbi:hybrid sensor histidine kinase/response regulator [Desulfogranum mediterraneum]|uniref:hybrid sensor histidine kinase/response regulator n=1 Tax=Desulfogranum mediterraneum TaxID=160661 RepID=UPI000418E7B4|nr:response regulator [Desulfogranum mediterraneum]
MEQLPLLLSKQQDRLTRRIVSYAGEQDYGRHTSTRAKAWPASVSQLNLALAGTIASLEEIPPLHASSRMEHSPMGVFAAQMAESHRAQGIPLSRFMGLLKCFRQGYLDEIQEQATPKGRLYVSLINRFFDWIELGVCDAWQKPAQPNQGKDSLEWRQRLSRESKLHLTLLEHIREPVFWLDPNLAIQYANQAGITLLSQATQSHSPPSGATGTDSLCSTPFPWFEQELRSLVANPDSSLTSLPPLILGTEARCFSFQIIPVLDLHTKLEGFAVIAEDVTKEQQTRAAFQESEARLRAFFESSSEGIAIHRLISDQAGTPLDYQTIEANQAFPVDLHDQPPSFLAACARAARGEPLQQLEHYDPGSGRHYLIKIFGLNRKHVATIHSDITARIHREKELKQTVEIVNTIMRAAPSAVGMVHSLGSRNFGWVNDRMCAMVGYQRRELLGKSARMLYPDEEEYQRTGQAFVDQLRDKPVGWVETRWLHKNGKVLHIQLTYAPLDSKDHSQGIVFTGLDITEGKRLAEEQARLEQQLQRTQKLESLGVLAGGIAHDFNNILVAVLGNTDLALSELPQHSAARPYLQNVETASRRAGDLCRQLLAYSGKGRFVITRLQFQEIIEEMTCMLQVSIAKNAVLKFRFSDGVPPVEADATQLRQVIMNLVINASEAIESRSGVISISTGAIECNEEYLQTTFLNQNLNAGVYSYIEVSDTGIGMESATREKLFEPFYTTKFSGRGLGMSAVLGIVRGHQGAIKVYSEAGKGTTIKVMLPAASQDLAPMQSAEGEEQQSWQGEGTILVVDDEDTVLVVAKNFLEKFGFTVITAKDGAIAVDIYRSRQEEITAVLMDLTMPRLDGQAAFSQMKVINPQVKVVLSSGYNEQEVSERFGGKGTAGFIQKPYRMMELKQTLQQLLG